MFPAPLAAYRSQGHVHNSNHWVAAKVVTPHFGSSLAWYSHEVFVMTLKVFTTSEVSRIAFHTMALHDVMAMVGAPMLLFVLLVLSRSWADMQNLYLQSL